MKNFFCYFLGFGLLLGHNTLQGQPKQVIPPSPEAAAFNKFLNYPVNYNTGVPEISIPLHEISVGGMKLPITLSYHASGIKVNELSTWVGLGWNLSLEPQISRNINGKDDLGNGYLSNTKVGAYVNGNWGTRDKYYFDEMDKGTYDEQPDQFNYKLASSSGSFMFQKYANNQYEILPIPYTPLKINCTNINTGLPKVFDIKDIDGTQYLFDVREEGSPNLVNNYLTNWKCSQMVSPSKKDTIKFQYNALRTTNSFGYSEYVILADSSYRAYENTSRPSIYNYSNAPISAPDALYQGNDSGSGKFTAFEKNDPIIGFVGYGFKFGIMEGGGYGYTLPSQIYGAARTSSNSKSVTVDEISFRGGKVKLFSHQASGIPEAGSRLDSIKVYDSNMVVIKTIKLFLSFFKTPDVTAYPAPDYRLRLDSVVFSDRDKKLSSYKFEYNYPETVYPWAKRSDAWGYYQDNGYYVNNGTSVPYFSNVNIVDNHQIWGAGSAHTRRYTQDIGGLSKEAYEEPTKYYILKKIIYPTKGRTEYSFGINKHKENGVLKNAGGLRVESIKTYADETSTNSISEKIYRYGENEEGDGELKVNPNSSNYVYEQTVIITDSADPGRPNNGPDRRRTFVSTSMDDLFFSNGSPINYKTVSEYQKDLGVFTGKTVYMYSPYLTINGVPSLIPNSKHWPGTDITLNSIDVDGCKLLSTTDYAYNNGSFIWVKQVSNQYQKFEKPDKIHIGRVYRKTIYEPTSRPVYHSPSDYLFVAYPQEVATMLLSSQVEQSRNLLDTNHIITSTTNYYYDNPAHLQVTRIKTIQSDGDTTTNSISYPQDYASGTAFIDNMISNNVINSPIEKVNYVEDGGMSSILTAEAISYRQEGNGVPDKIFGLESELPVNSTNFKFANRSIGILPNAGTPTSYSLDGHYKEKLSYDNYDERYNPLRLTLNKKQLVSYIWGYNKMYPIAEARNASDNEIYYEGFEEPSINQWGASIFNSGSFGGPVSIDASLKHSGLNSGRIDNTNSQDKASHSKWLTISLTAPKKFRYSGWVYSNGPGAKLWLFMKRAGEMGYFTYIDNIISTQTDKWVYLEKDFLVPADVTALSLRIDAFGSASTWFDDLRICPSDAQMTTYTYKPLVGMTSQTDAKGLTTFFEYDRFQRLKTIKDFEGNIVKSYEYHYKGSTP